MAEYIERANIKYEQWSVGPLNEPLMVVRKKTIDSIPTADVAPVVSGRWEKNDYSQTVCSHCKVPIPGYWGQYDGCPDGVWTEIEPRICCPNCEAKMEESESK